jgi:hypothetical protein
LDSFFARGELVLSKPVPVALRGAQPLFLTQYGRASNPASDDVCVRLFRGRSHSGRAGVESRTALVLGNAAYPLAPPNNPVSDAA